MQRKHAYYVLSDNSQNPKDVLLITTNSTGKPEVRLLTVEVAEAGIKTTSVVTLPVSNSSFEDGIHEINIDNIQEPANEKIAAFKNAALRFDKTRSDLCILFLLETNNNLLPSVERRLYDRVDKIGSKFTTKHLDDYADAIIKNTAPRAAHAKPVVAPIADESIKPTAPNKDEPDLSKFIAACESYLSRLQKQPNNALAIKKAEIIENALQILNNVHIDNTKKLDLFQVHLINNKKTLGQRRDHWLMTFVKALGVLGATIFGLGFGGYAAYQSLFGSRATSGLKLVNAVTESRQKVALKA